MLDDAELKFQEELRMQRQMVVERVQRAGGKPDTSQIERDWRTWLTKCAPKTFTGSFAPFHSSFWDWFWRIAQRRRHSESLTEEELVFLAIWARGQGKSSNVEWAAIAEGALVGSGYVLYVSGTQALAQEHVASIRDRIEAEEIAKYYPSLSNPEIGRHGNQRGWRQDFLRTDSGWAIRPVGLDVGVRGGKVGEQRPSLIILDDIDDHSDSPLIVQKKLETISRGIIPSGMRDTAILGAQNLIHRNSVFNQILTRKTSVLSRRIVSGPFPAFDGLQLEHRQTEKGPRNFIVGGHPTWEDFDLAACQKFLDDSGREAFLAEYQHDFSAIEEGRVLPEYDESIHVITWSQFAVVYGQKGIPKHWQRDCGHDIGYTEGHQSAWTWIATSAMNSKIPGLRFRYRGMVFTKPLLDEMAEAVLERMLEESEAVDSYSRGSDYAARYAERLKLLRSAGSNFAEVKRWRMSHEKKGERDTYRVKFGIPFISCRSGKIDGLAQWRHYLRVDKSKPHPFHEDELIADGVYRLGRPGWFDVVADDQLYEPLDDFGLATHRRQARDWKYAPDRLSVTGIPDTLPMKMDEDSCDATRMITAEWGPEEEDFTPDEKREQALPVGARRDVVEQLTGDARDLGELQRDYYGKKHDREARANSTWSNEVMDSGDNPWANLQ